MVFLKHVTKRIKGRDVLIDVTYRFEKGKIYGLFGTNGSGKTMLLRTIAGLVIPSEGEVEINQEILHKDISFPKSLGLIIENMELLPELSAFENLRQLGKIANLATEKDIVEAIERVGILPDLPVKQFSLGMKQRLNIAQAIFEKPEIILLDEPTNALDDEGIERIKHILLEEKERGACIIIASHDKQQIATLCDKTIKLYEGKIVEEN